MPNKQITDLDPLVGGMDDAYNFWTQVDGGGAGSSFQMAWSKLFVAKNAVSGNGTDLSLVAGNGSGSGSSGGWISGSAGDGDATDGYGGYIDWQAGEGYIGGTAQLIGGAGTYAGTAKLYGGTGTTYGGSVRIKPGSGPTVGFVYITDLRTTNPGGANRVWRDAGVLKIT